MKARQVIFHVLSEIDENVNSVDATERLLRELDEAGYVILPKEPTEAMTNHPEYTSGNWSRRNWEAILRSVGGE